MVGKRGRPSTSLAC